jgi:hypothetical protein
MISLIYAVESEPFLINHLRLPSEIGRATAKRDSIGHAKKNEEVKRNRRGKWKHLNL